ncbi:MAG: LamG-like jellyroll fold domain-containing protein [Verrucomicrobiota bacterium JB023]|nr:LamG-like jellyroll fold domain-containing protein [Verrucomicrobiota bacterium JB023]
MKPNSKTTLIASGLLASLTGTGLGDFLAIDFRDGRGSATPDGPVDIPTVRAAFESADPALTSASDADFFVWGGNSPINVDALFAGNLSGNNGSTWGNLATETAFGTLNVVTEGSVGGYRAGEAAWNDLEPISETYCFEGNSGDINTLTVSGFSSQAGDLITLTCWGVGDNLSQDARFTAYYGELSQTAETLYNDGGARDDSTGSIPWVQFQFVSDGLTDFISFDWQQTDNGGTGAFNGFSLSVTEATFGSVTSATLSAEESVFLVGAPDTQVTASANFSLEGEVNVTSLGDTVVTYSSSDESVATVGPDGTVDLLAPGSTDITATVFGDGGSQVTSNAVTIMVEAPTNFTFSIGDPFYQVAFGPDTDVNVTADSANLTAVPLEGYTGFYYESSNEDSVFVNDDQTGALQFDYPGTATLSAVLPNPGGADFEGTTEIIVEEATSINVTVPTSTLYIGGAGTTVNAEVTTATLTDPISINGLFYTEFSTDFGSDIFVDTVTGEATPGTDTSALGDSTITVDFGLPPNAISGTVTLTLAEVPLKPTVLLHDYDFSGTTGASAPSGTIIPDTVGGANGVIVDDGATFTADGLMIPGGVQNPAEGEPAAAYVDLPNGMISALPDATTFEAWVTVDSTGNWVRIFDFGNSEGGENNPGYQSNHFNLIARRSGSGVVTSELSTSRRQLGGTTLSTSATVTVGQKHYFVVTLDTEIGVRNIYFDGVLVGTDSLPFDNSDLSDFVTELGEPNDLNNWLGRSNAGDNRLAGTFHEFRIYEGTMTEAEVAANFGLTTGGLALTVTSFADGNLNLDASGLTSGATYHFQRLNLGTLDWESIAGSEFDAAATSESRVIATGTLDSTELIRLIEGAEIN